MVKIKFIKMRLITTFLLLLHLTYFVLCVKHFRLGRSKGGNYGAPVLYDEKQPLPSSKRFKQTLDHTSPSNLKTWEQRYFVNEEFYKENNPGTVFLMIGGEGPADPRWMVDGEWINYAKFFNALCFNLEHRYYGESHPIEDISTKNLQYLSSTQALGDIAAFIIGMNKLYNLPETTKWITFGGSYSGSLAAWVRAKYPHLVYGSVSSSGPLLAKVNFLEYYKVVVTALRDKTGGHDDCVNQIKLAHTQIASLLQEQPDIIEREFKLCKKISEASPDDIKNFYNSIADDFADLVQYNDDNRIGIGANERRRNFNIYTVCKTLTKSDKPAYQKLAEFNQLIMDKNNQTCLDYSYDNMISELRNVSWGQDEARQWMYQTCTEFGFYQTSSAAVDVFGNGFTVDFFTQQCEDVFGKKFNADFVTRAAAWTNIEYGGLNIKVDRVVFVHGSIDPWHALGITETKNNNSPAIYIRGTAHCADMYPPADSDLDALRRARAEVQHLLAAWVGLP